MQYVGWHHIIWLMGSEVSLLKPLPCTAILGCHHGKWPLSALTRFVTESKAQSALMFLVTYLENEVLSLFIVVKQDSTCSVLYLATKYYTESFIPILQQMHMFQLARTYCNTTLAYLYRRKKYNDTHQFFPFIKYYSSKPVNKNTLLSQKKVPSWI